MKIASKNQNSIKIFYSKAKEILQQKEQKQDQKKIFINNKYGITVGDIPQTFYYYYDNNEYYFTAKNAKFSIDLNGNITWYYGQWVDGFFRNGVWLDGTWDNGTFCRGNWIDGTWINGQWFKGSIDGTLSAFCP